MAHGTHNGFCPNILQHILQITEGATPSRKLEPEGFLCMLLNQTGRDDVTLNEGNTGHRRSVQVKYKQRFTVDMTDTAKSCDQTQLDPWQEVPVELSSTRQGSIFLEDETLARYCTEMSSTIAAGQPASKFSQDLFGSIMNMADALLQGVTQDLQTTAAAAIGINRRVGNNAATALNLTLDTNSAPLADGHTQLLSDYKQNQALGRPQVVGSGLYHNFAIQQAAKTAPNQSGLDTKVQFGGVDFYFDPNFANSFGANQIVAYEPDAIQLVEYMEYTGFKAGDFPGQSSFFTMALPSRFGPGQDDICPIMFDAQLRYVDCPEGSTDAYYGTALTLQKGWQIILSKQSGLFTIPFGAYRGTDVLSQNRGSYRYTLTNT